MGPARRSLHAVVAAAFLVLAVSCTDGDDDRAPAGTRRPSATASDETPNTPSRTPPESIIQSPTPTASAPEDPAEAEEQLRDSWARFFSPESSVKKRADVAENGGQYELMIEALATDPKARLLRVRVDSVTFTSDLDATVRYTLFSGGLQVGPDGPGTSVRQDDTWTVSFKTVCSLTKYGNDVPPAATC